MSNRDKKEYIYKKEDAYRNLEMVNSWITAIDTKASFLLAYLAVIMGFVFSKGFPDFLCDFNFERVSVQYIVELLFVLILYTSLLISIYLFITTLLARTNKKDERQSLLFFVEIANLNLNDFKSKVLSQNEEEIIKDILDQIHENSSICKRKSQLLNYGVVSTLVVTISFVVCSVFHLV